mgnify:CR=1 FL=1
MAIIDNYTPYTWTDKELITATKLNRIENTIAAINDGAINTIGDSTMNGSFTFINQNEYNETPVIYALGQNGNLGLGGTILYKHSDNSGNPRYQWYFRQQIPRGSDSSVYEQYCFPTVDTTRTQSITYKILTTKTSGLRVHHDFSGSTIENGVVTSFGPWTVEESGIYLLIGTACFSANATGLRQIGLSGASNSTNFDRYAVTRVNAVETANTVTTIEVTYVANLTAGDTIYLQLRQDSGSTLNVTYPGIQSLRII